MDTIKLIKPVIFLNCMTKDLSKYLEPQLSKYNSMQVIYMGDFDSPEQMYYYTRSPTKDSVNLIAHQIKRRLEDFLKTNKLDVRLKVQKPRFESKYVEEEEMYRAFNMGVGMVWVVEPENVDAVLANTDGYVIGALAHGEKGVEMV